MTAPTYETGTILDVEQVTLGSELAGDAAQGATTLTIDDASDFDADGGGTCSVNGAQYVYTVTDVDGGVLTLGSGLTAAASDGDRVDVWDTATGSAATWFEVLVQLPGADAVDATPARLASALVPTFTHKLGIRDEGTGEACTLQHQGGEWVVVEVPADTVQLDGAALKGGTVPQSSLGFTLPDGTSVAVSTSPPATPAVGDLWLDGTDGNTIKKWDGTAWTPYQFGPSAIADGAITTPKVDFTARDIGAPTSSFSPTAPSNAKLGDLWYDTANGARLNRFDGSLWVSAQLGTEAIAPGAITSGNIADFAVSVRQINDNRHRIY